MIDPAAAAREARRSALLVELPDRAVWMVRGSDARRWLNGVVTTDLAAIDASGERNGSYGLVLTRQGRIVADVLVVARATDRFLLEFASPVAEATREHLMRTIVADDVALEDESMRYCTLQLEGPQSTEILAAAADSVLRESLDGCPRDSARDVSAAGEQVMAIAHGWSGERAWRLLVPREPRAEILRRLREAGRSRGLVEADGDALEILRVEAGTPRTGTELTREVLPAEVRLEERAVSFTKGCYTGQEVVARMHSRGGATHLMVGLAIEGDPLPARNTALECEGHVVGELTSVVRSASEGVIALGFVRRPHDAPGTRLAAGPAAAVVHPLPFVTPHGEV